MADKLIRVRAMANLEYHPKDRPDLTKLYQGPIRGLKGELIREGEILEVEESQFSDYDVVRKGANGSRLIRGSMKRLDAEPLVVAEVEPHLNLVAGGGRKAKKGEEI
jgi:hypothetical protein